MVTQRQAPKAAARSTDKDKHENLSLAEKRLLSKILNESVPGKGTDAVAFRARHAAQMQRLDALQAQRWLTRDGDRYRLPLATLPVLGSPKSKALVADGTRIFRHLVARYRAVPRSAVRVSTLAADSRLDESRVREALSYMLEAPWYAGHSTDLFSGPVDETSVTPGEEVVRRSSWKAWLQERQRQRTIEMRAHSEWNGGVASNFLQASAPIPDSRTKRSESLTPTLADWRKHLPPRIRHAFDEVLQAKQSDLRWLAAIGLRGIVEIVTVIALGRDVPTFKKKLELLHESRYLSDSDIRTLEAVIEVGNASAHRGHKPSAHDFSASVGCWRSAVAAMQWADELPACAQCHGPGGSGVGVSFPPLAGQPAGYIAQQLKAWQDGSRPAGPLGLMQAVARKLKDSDVQAVSDYYAGLGNTAPNVKPKGAK